MFKIGDLVTGTVDNKYGYTGRGAMCKVVGYVRVNVLGGYDDEKSIIRVKIIGFDDEMLRDGSSIRVSEATRHELIGAPTEYPVKACFFQPYHLYVEEGSVCKLNDYLDKM